MKSNALIMDKKDNVVTCVHGASQGEQISYRLGDEIHTVTTLEAIPACHKIAIRQIQAGEEVIKYGESLGVATRGIPVGSWVSHLNIHSLPRDYESELLS